MKRDPATNEPPPASSSTKGVGGDSSLKSTRPSQNSAFLWKLCSNEPQQDRVDIKQQAVLDGLRLGEKLSSILRTRINGRSQGIGLEELVDWPKRFDKTKHLYEVPHSTIGVIGVIGSGKSTLLNAILGERNLLPSSSDRAGTAVACRIRYNHGSDGYHAEILFRSRQSFTEELEKLFQNLEAKRELRTRMKENPDEEERDDIEDQLEELETSTSGTIDTLRVLFGVKEEDLGVLSANTFLEAYPMEELGTTVAITESDLEIFFSKIKSFLDSTPANYKGKKNDGMAFD
ncbi:hypothetical protein SLS64_003485 [Diaporthe eres]|uniref:Dynamin N-terminal domain-containing protein n=1 Tax=Diaporthe eres TaxID=83184 RepID=A0ABR1NTC0_DIAER